MKFHLPSSTKATRSSGLPVIVLAFSALACGGLAVREEPASDGSVGADGGPSSDGGGALRGAPLPFAATQDGFGLNAVVEKGSPSDLKARVRASGRTAWSEPVVATVAAPDVAQWRFSDLSPGLRYEYEILAPAAAGMETLYAGSAVTQKPRGQPFTFALITDSHIGADLSYSNQGDPEVLRAVSSELDKLEPDFLIHLGDMLDFHQYGFNDPPPTGAVTRDAYLNYRTLLGDTLGKTTHFATIGNWEGENGSYTPHEIARSREQRLRYLPGPDPSTYPEGGCPYQDFYAFTWGDALFVVLNVMTYTPSDHLLGSYPGFADDWTLGNSQLEWLGRTLANATARWRFLFIHHPVGGKAANEVESAYGRGGGQAADVGEQAVIHGWMKQYGVQIFFYGHDHVFTDMVVDGIHYTEPGNSGAIWMFSNDMTGYTQSWLEPGFGQVTVRPDSVDVQLINTSGELLHEYTLP